MLREIGTGYNERCVRMSTRTSVFLSLVIILAMFLSASTHATSSRSCDSSNGVSSIEIQIPGSGAIPADQQLQLSAVPKNSAGDPMGVSLTWSVSNGSINWDGLFTPWQKGEVAVTVCSGDVWSNATVSVLQGETVAVGLNLSKDELTSDETVVLDPRRIDTKGNSAPAYVPTENWTIPEGSHLQQGSETIWVPSATGAFVITMDAYGLQANATLNVSHGIAYELMIVGDQNISSDLAVSYDVLACDAKENCWTIGGEWSALPESSLSLDNNTTSGVILTPLATGVVSLMVESLVDGQLLETEMDIQIHSGVAVLTIVMAGTGEQTTEVLGTVIQMQAGTTLELSVTLVDSVGSEWQSMDVEWRLNQSGIANFEVSTGATFNFTSDITGEWDLMVSPSDGVPSKYSLEVLPGEVSVIEVTPVSSTAMRVSTGSSIGLQVIGKDGDGNPFALDVEWMIDESVGSMRNDTKGTGSYVYTPSVEAHLGTQVLSFIGPLGTRNLAIELVAGELAGLVIIFESGSEGEQGDVIRFSVVGEDANGNFVEADLAGLQVECTCGKVRSLDGTSFEASLTEHGKRHTVSAEMEGIPRSVEYIDITPTLFDGLLGSNSQVLSIGILLTGGLLLFVAIVIFRRSRASDEDADAPENEHSQQDLSAPSQPFAIHNVQRTPMAAPPASAFGVMTQPPPLAYAPFAASLSASIPATAAPATLSSAIDILAPAISDETVVEEEDSATRLMAASSTLLGGNDSVIDSTESESQVEPGENKQPELLIEADGPEMSEIAEEQVVSEEPETIEEHEAVVGSEKEGSVEVEELVLIASDEGPMTTAGVLLKALPGTVAGKAGWYHGIEGRPMRWDGPQ